MKRITIFVLALLSIVSCGTAEKAGSELVKTKQNYVVGFYNLENLFDIYDDPVKNDDEYLPDGANKWTEAKYTAKLHNMASVIAEMAKANGRFHTVLGVSEVENRLVLEDLVSQPELAAANYQIVHYDSPDRRGVDVALLYNPKQFKVLESRAIPFTFDPAVEYPDTDTSYFRTRDVLMVHGLIDNERFAFYVCHLPSRVGGKGGDLRSRGAQIAYDDAIKMQQKYPGIKIVVMGDMNDDPFDASMVTYLHGRETLEEVTTDEDFFSPYLSMIKAGFGSLCYQGTWCIYDLELVNNALANAPQGGLKIQPVTSYKKKWYYGVIFKRPFMTTQSGQYKGYPFRTFSNGSFAGGYSDHYPTYIVIGK